MASSTKNKPKSETKTTTNVPATRAKGPAPDYLKRPEYKSERRGLSNDSADYLIPLIYVLNDLSKPVLKRDPAYIEGAEPGDILLRSYADPIIKGSVGIYFQPTYYDKCWMEWRPRKNGGGFMGRHTDRPDDAIEAQADEGNRIIFRRPNGNEVIETRQHYGIVHLNKLRLPYIIPFQSTGHTISRDWMNKMGAKTLDDGSQTDTFAQLWHITTRMRVNQFGSWYQLAIEDAGWVTPEDFAIGKAMWISCDKGESRAAEAENLGERTRGAEGDDAPM